MAERRGVFIASVTEPVDSSSPIGLAMLRILVALAGLESATTGIRVRASKRQAAEEGRPPPVKAYGLTRQWDGIVESEAAVLREAAHRAMAGERLASVARDLRSRGIPSPSGRLWTDATLGRLLRNPRLVGDRAYKGQVVARDCWPAILDRETFARLQLTLNHPGRQGAPPRHHKRLATGFAQCGLCGQNMATTTRSGDRYYSCPTQPTGCGRIHVHADRLEAWLLDQLLEQLRLEPPPTAQDADPGDTAAAMAELCRDYYVDRIVSREAFLSARALLVRRADELLATSGSATGGGEGVGGGQSTQAARCARPRATTRPPGRPARPARGQPHDQAATWRVRRPPAPMRMEDTGVAPSVKYPNRALFAGPTTGSNCQFMTSFCGSSGRAR